MNIHYAFSKHTFFSQYRDETQPEMIADESAEKPEGWLDDEPELVPDPAAEKPSDWYVLLLLL